MLISEIITELIGPTGGDTSDTDLAALWLTIIKSALRKLPANVRDRCLIDIFEISISANSSSATLPSGFIKERDKHSVYYMSSGSRQIIPIETRGRFNDIFNSETSGTPTNCNIYGRTIELDKKSAEALTVYIEGFKSVSDVEASDTFFGSDDLIDAVKELAKFEYYHDYEEDEEKGKAHLLIAKDALEKIDGDFMEREMGSHVEEA